MTQQSNWQSKRQEIMPKLDCHIFGDADSYRATAIEDKDKIYLHTKKKEL